jgi:hypothetical protein
MHQMKITALLALFAMPSQISHKATFALIRIQALKQQAFGNSSI